MLLRTLTLRLARMLETALLAGVLLPEIGLPIMAYLYSSVVILLTLTSLLALQL